MVSGFDIFAAIFTLASFLVIIVAIIYWMITVIDAFKRKYKNKDEKIKWLLIVNLLGYIGVGLYERKFKGYFKKYNFKPTLKNVITTLIITFVIESITFLVIKKIIGVDLINAGSIYLFVPAIIISFPIIITVYPIACALLQKPKRVE